jgi:hypothetical protein
MREEFANMLLLNTPVRQSLGSAPRFNDVQGSFGALAEAVTAKGSNLCDYLTAQYTLAPQCMICMEGASWSRTIHRFTGSPRRTERDADPLVAGVSTLEV